jgi:hypothetical protein
MQHLSYGRQFRNPSLPGAIADCNSTRLLKKRRGTQTYCDILLSSSDIAKNFWNLYLRLIGCKVYWRLAVQLITIVRLLPTKHLIVAGQWTVQCMGLIMEQGHYRHCTVKFNHDNLHSNSKATENEELAEGSRLRVACHGINGLICSVFTSDTLKYWM